MKRILFILITVPFIGFGQVDEWKQGYISDYNTYEDNIFNFQIKIHNSLNEIGDFSYYYKKFEDQHNRFTMTLEIDGIEVRTRRENIGSMSYGDPRLIWYDEKNRFLNSHDEILKKQKGITYKFKNDDYYVVSGNFENKTFYFMTIKIMSEYGNSILKVKLFYDNDEKELGSEMSDQIFSSLKNNLK